jgi:membrane protease YdiL (CAAX protease family)
MAGESLFYALLLGTAVIALMRFFSFGVLNTLSPPLQMGRGGSLSAGQAFMLSLGAGVFEELLFRVLLMGGMVWFCVKVWRCPRSVALLLSGALSSLIFSAFHYVGALGDPFSLESFLFRFWAGACLATVYGVRGFGIAVWTHALYDLTVFFGQAVLGQ